MRRRRIQPMCPRIAWKIFGITERIFKTDKRTSRTVARICMILSTMAAKPIGSKIFMTRERISGIDVRMSVIGSKISGIVKIEVIDK
jgi:hypothetical protein